MGTALAAALAVVLSAPAAVAQEHDYADTIREALSEFDLGHFEESLALFRLAHSLRPSARTLRGLGNCSFELRHYVDAVTHYRDALASTENPLTAEQRTEVEHLLSRARVFVGGYRLAVTPAGASVTIDSAAATGSDVLLAIGDHTIAVSAPGYVARNVPVTVRGGEDETLTIALEASAGAGGTAPMLATGMADTPVQGTVTPPPPTVTYPAEVHVRVEARTPGLVLHAMLDDGAHTSFTPVCAAPCEATLAGGSYAVGISVGAGEPHPAGWGRLTLDHDATLGLVFEDRDGLRVGGGVTIGLGLVLGLALIITGAVLNPEDLAGPGGDARERGDQAKLGLIAAGAVLIPVSAIVAVILAINEDEVSVRELGSGVRF